MELTSYVSRPCGGDSEAYIKVKQMSASWSSEDDKKVLDGITFELDKVCTYVHFKFSFIFFNLDCSTFGSCGTSWSWKG